jgi:hypothetical protein
MMGLVPKTLRRLGVSPSCMRAIACVLTTATLVAGDYGRGTPFAIDNCADELDKLKRTSEKGALVARDVVTATTRADAELQNARRQCERWGSDALSCTRARKSHQEAVAQVDRAEQDFRFAYVDVQARVSGAEYACRAYGTTPAIPGVSERNRELCLIFRSYRNAPMGLVPKLNADCRSNGMSEDECRSCLVENYRPREEPDNDSASVTRRDLGERQKD